MIATETKLDSSFPNGKFSIDRFAKLLHRGKNKNGVSVMIIVRDDIPIKEIKVNFLPFNMECLFIELNIRKAKWLVVGFYHLPSQNVKYTLYSLSSNYEKFILIGDFKSEDCEIEISSFINNHEAKNIVKEKLCLSKVFGIPCVYLFITSSPKTHI